MGLRYCCGGMVESVWVEFIVVMYVNDGFVNENEGKKIVEVGDFI